MGIFTITILDFGTRFKERFSLNNKNLLDALPDKICVPYNKMKNRMINMGFDRKKIAVIGNGIIGYSVSQYCISARHLRC